MTYLPADLIRKKRFGEAHSHAEITFLIQNYATGAIPDYQMSAWLMAVCFNGMTNEETAWLTHEMRDSGTVLQLSHLGTTVDKHSTGGVGDKTSLILAPIVAAAGVPVPMIAGRGLGHTGGTLDKLESIPGFSVRLTEEQFTMQVATIGSAIMGQTDAICPADRKMYALRDVTGTVDSLPLICSSIMSKKLAEGINALVLDVKFGSGAFMKTQSDAESLARALMHIGQRSGKKVTALITNMNEPLGRFVGNALEVQECLDILDGKTFRGDGKGYDDTLRLTLELAAHMIFLGQKAENLDTARALAIDLLESGEAREKFNEICKAQGGQLKSPLPQAPEKHFVQAESDGYMNYVDLSHLGNAAIWMGAGRRAHSDAIDPAAGIEVFRQQGVPIRRGEKIFCLYASSSAAMEASLSSVDKSFSISADPILPPSIIANVLQ